MSLQVKLDSVISDKLCYETVDKILDHVLLDAVNTVEKRLKADSIDELKSQSCKVINDVVDQVGNNASPSVTEADIEKKIKDFRRVSEVQTAVEMNDVIESGYGETFFSPDWSKFSTNYPIGSGADDNYQIQDTFDGTASVDMDDRQLKRKKLKRMKRGPSNLHLSPVLKQSRLMESFSDASSSLSDASFSMSVASTTSLSPLLASTPSMATSIPWSGTESVPPIFWSYARGLENIDEYPIDAENTKMTNEENLKEKNVDLREILKRRKYYRSTSNTDCDSVPGINKIKVTVGKETGVRKVEAGDAYSADHGNELEEGEVMESNDMSKEEINLRYDKNLLSDLLQKKKVLEHLIDMVNKEKSGEDNNEDVSDDENISKSSSVSSIFDENISSEVSCMFDNREELSSRRVVYRSSSPCSPMAEDLSRNVLNDFNSELDNGLRDLFPSKQAQHSPEASIKIEPVSDDESNLDNVAPSVNHTSSPIYTSKSAGKFDCTLCNVTVPGRGQRCIEEHMKGKKHQANVHASSCLILPKSKPGRDVRGLEERKVCFYSEKKIQQPKTASNVTNKPLRKKIVWDLK